MYKNNLSNDFFNELDDKEIDMMLKYVPEYTVAASILFATTLAYAGLIDISKIYRIIFGENSEYIEQYIEPLVVENQAPLSIESEYDGIVIKLISAINSDTYNHNDVAYVEYGDGTIIELDQSSIHTYNGESTLTFAGHVIEVEKVQDIIINDERINVSP